MKRIKRDTGKDLFTNVLEMLKESGEFSKAEEILDYTIASSGSDKEITNYEFEFYAYPNFGGSEGIYVDVEVHGFINEDSCEKTTMHIGTFKTLRTDLEASKIMGELAGMMVYYAHKYINENFERYMPEDEFRTMLETKKIKEVLKIAEASKISKDNLLREAEWREEHDECWYYQLMDYSIDILRKASEKMK